MTTQSDVALAQAGQNGVAVTDLLEAGQVQGRIRSTIATWVSDGTEGQNPVIDIVQLPLGAYVIDATAVILSPLPAGATATLGDGDADRFLTAIDGDAAAGTETGTYVGANRGYRVSLAANQMVRLTSGGNVTPVAGDSVRVVLQWSQT